VAGTAFSWAVAQLAAHINAKSAIEGRIGFKKKRRSASNRLNKAQVYIVGPYSPPKLISVYERQKHR
jgi:hypothetical protein